jgi:protein-L-isoaspartate O-methyltransferase
MHAYVMQLRALDVRAGDEIVDLGGGTGYGAAIAARVVGERGRVTTIEIDPSLSQRATEVLGDLPNVKVLRADAHDVTLWRGATKVMVGFDVGEIPRAWIDALGPGGRIVCPASGELLVMDAAGRRSLGPVRYVRDRSETGKVEASEPTRVVVA